MSTRITNSMVSRSVLADLTAVSNRLTRTQEKIASGKEITRPSDDPYAASRAVGLRATLDKTNQYVRNVEDGQGWQEASEQALNAITNYVASVKEAVIQGGSDSLDQAGRDAVRAKVDELIKGIKQEANTNYQGRYLFSGIATLTEPYPDPDPPLPTGQDAYQGDTSSVVITRTIGPSVSVQINTRIDSVFGNGDGDGKLLATLRDISAHLASPDTAADLRGPDLNALDASFNQLLAVRSQNGALANRLETADSRLAQLQETLTSQLSQTEDADIAKTLIDFNSQAAAYQAALKAGATIIQPSLMDFLG